MKKFAHTEAENTENNALKSMNDLNDVVVGYADCFSEGPGFESRVSHGPFQKV
jgi:hypothetical protein